LGHIGHRWPDGRIAGRDLVFRAEFVQHSVRNTIAAVSTFEWLTLYALATILLVSMVFLFRLKRRAISWFAVYIGLSTWVSWGYAIAPVNPPFFDELVSLGGLIVALVVLGYMLRLRKREILA
jgi:hypothetical protein